MTGILNPHVDPLGSNAVLCAAIALALAAGRDAAWALGFGVAATEHATGTELTDLGRVYADVRRIA